MKLVEVFHLMDYVSHLAHVQLFRLTAAELHAYFEEGLITATEGEVRDSFMRGTIVVCLVD